MSTVASRLRASGAPRLPGRLRARLAGLWAAGDTRRTPNFLVFTTAIGVLNAIGLVMVLSASSVLSLDDKGSPWWFFQRQLMWSVLGLTAFLVCSRVDYRTWRRITIPFLAVTLVLLVVVLIPGIGIWVDGSRRWLGWGTLRLQPSEVAKLALLILTADVLTRRERELDDWRVALRPTLVVTAVVAGLVMLEPDLASTMVITIVVGSVLVVGGIRLRHLAAVGATAIALVTAFSLLVPWRRARMLSFLDPWSDSSNAGYQVTQSLIALGSGGWTGVGLGASRAKWRFLPAAHTDFIFAIVGEELGLLGAGLVIGLFVMLAVAGVRTALRSPDRFGMLVAGAVTAWIIGQAVVNLGAVVGVLPVTGVPLPFVSFGGSALVITMAAAGVLANVARQGR
ncbi:MAG: putative lipid II flippase FtsW [Actinobacteria bacterium]|nr:putative lipid II flippase FtsW [Actinomycetota bacterium]